MKRANVDKAAESTSESKQVVITQDGHPPKGVAIPLAVPAKTRVGGQLRGQITESADCWHSDA